MDKKRTYLDLNFKPDPEKYVLTTLFLDSISPLRDAADAIAAESSTGTWTNVGTMNDSIFDELSAKVYELNELTKVIKIAYPLALFETDNIPQVLADVGGNIFGMKEVRRLQLMDIELPSAFLKANPGPARGIQGIREYTGVGDRPLLGTIIKPKVGLPTKEHARVAYEAWVGGVDLVKDDENLTDQPFNPFDERIKHTLEAKVKAEQETGEKKIYAANISGHIMDMEHRAELIRQLGGECMMIDIMTVGYAGLQHMRMKNTGLIIHGHRAMHGAFTHIAGHGITMLVLAKLARMAGVDSLHTGTVIGKMEGNKKDVTEIDDFLKSEWGGLKTTLPVASGGLHPGHVAKLYKLLGKDVLINMGGGIHGHPDGTRAGAIAARQALEAAINGIPLEKYAKEKGHCELALALDKWGVFGEEKYTKPITYFSKYLHKPDTK